MQSSTEEEWQNADRRHGDGAQVASHREELLAVWTVRRTERLKRRWRAVGSVSRDLFCKNGRRVQWKCPGCYHCITAPPVSDGGGDYGWNVVVRKDCIELIVCGRLWWIRDCSG